jgi:hypothetical protein
VDPSRLWRRQDLRRKDFRFLNAGAFQDEDLSRAFPRGSSEESFLHFFYQFASSHDCKKFDPALLARFPELIRKRDFKRTQALFKNQKRLRPTPGVPADLLTIG